MISHPPIFLTAYPGHSHYCEEAVHPGQVISLLQDLYGAVTSDLCFRVLILDKNNLRSK